MARTMRAQTSRSYRLLIAQHGAGAAQVAIDWLNESIDLCTGPPCRRGQSSRRICWRCANITSDEFQNFHNPEWLCYVVIATALYAFGTVPQHCECGHRYDRDSSCLRIGLQPPRHVEPGNIGQLYVKQD